MRQDIDVIAIFESGKRKPRPIRFKLLEINEKISVNIDHITGTEEKGAGLVKRFEYYCESVGIKGVIKYKIIFLMVENRWVLET